jgi:hypothetical protein
MTAVAPRGAATRTARRLTDSILHAFYQACDQGSLEVAASLLACCEASMEMHNDTTVERRQNDEALILAFEHLWFLRMSQGGEGVAARREW